MLPSFADHRNPNSLTSRMRSKRNLQFRAALEDLPTPIKILDVGGRQAVWESIGFVNRSNIEITIINVEHIEPSYQNMVCIVGDARDMRKFENRQFDVVYSNSVIEHLGGIEDMHAMAREIQRVGKRYFVQTPNLYFPIEPHFVFPFFQFLPVPWRVCLVQHFNLGWMTRVPDRMGAERKVKSVKLLSRSQLRSLFPGADIIEEKFFGVTKSLIACKFGSR